MLRSEENVSTMFLSYTVKILTSCEAFTVQMDTGSSDLWVLPGSTQIPLTETTNITIEESYGSGTASGMIQFAHMEFAGFTVPEQGASLLVLRLINQD